MFNEKTQAFVVGSYYKHLTEKNGDMGKTVFVKGTQKYSEQRGARMALRALRDGYPLDYSSYFAYGEWTPTIKAESKLVGENGEKRTNIFKCAWADTFKEMGLTDCGVTYCYQIDEGIVRGFNPALKFKTHQNLSDSDYCDLQFIGSDMTKEVPLPKDGKKTWEYHTAHTMKAYKEICFDIYGNDEIYELVKKDFEDRFGKDMLDTVEKEMAQDFNRI